MWKLCPHHNLCTCVFYDVIKMPSTTRCRTVTMPWCRCSHKMLAYSTSCNLCASSSTKINASLQQESSNDRVIMSIASYSNDTMLEDLWRKLAPAILPASVHLYVIYITLELNIDIYKHWFLWWSKSCISSLLSYHRYFKQCKRDWKWVTYAKSCCTFTREPSVLEWLAPSWMSFAWPWQMSWRSKELCLGRADSSEHGSTNFCAFIYLLLLSTRKLP